MLRRLPGIEWLLSGPITFVVLPGRPAQVALESTQGSASPPPVKYSPKLLLLLPLHLPRAAAAAAVAIHAWEEEEEEEVEEMQAAVGLHSEEQVGVIAVVIDHKDYEEVMLEWAKAQGAVVLQLLPVVLLSRV